MSGACVAGTPLPLEELIAYHLGELDGEPAEAVEEHYFACGACARRLEAVGRLAAGIVEVVRRGEVTASVTSTLLARGVERGLRVRRYRVSPGEAVSCTAAPDDDFVAIVLGLGLREADAIDVAVSWVALDTGATEERAIEEVSVERDVGEVVLLFSGARIREAPRSRWEMYAVVHAAGQERRVGPYVLNHTPWEELAEPRDA